jgi:hypothetical protein
MNTFYIYHLPGWKVGCASNPTRRLTEYRNEGYTGQMVIIDRIIGSIHKAGDAEKSWARQFGYKPSRHYKDTGARYHYV